MPDVVLEMHSGPNTSRNNTTSGSVAEGVHWSSTTTAQDPAGAQFDFPRWNVGNESSFGPVPAHIMFPTAPTALASNKPPSYKEVIYGDSGAVDPLLSKPAQWTPSPQETQSGASRDVSSWDALPGGDEQEEEIPKKTAIEESGDFSESGMLLVRLAIVVGVIVGIGLCLWEVSYQNSLSSYATSMERKQKGLRAGFGGFILVFAVLCYFGDAFTNATYKTIDGIRSEELTEHLAKIRRARPKITWYMKCFHRDIHSTVVTGPDGSLATQQRNDQIEAWSGLQEFQYSTWEDASDPFEEKGAINQITFHKKFIFANEQTRASFEAQKQAFITANRHRDQEFSVEEIFEIEGFRSAATVASSSAFCVTNVCVYFIMVFSCLLYPWLCILNAREAYVEHTHVVKVSV